jgi:hypothetical protein
MLRHIVQANSRTYLFSPDDPVPLGGRIWAIVRLRVTDELTGAAPDGKITIQTKQKGLVPRVGSDGIVGLVGIPQQVPGLGTVPFTVQLTVNADGYVPRDVELPFIPDATFPATFTPPPIQNLALHREPIVILGRTVRANGNTNTPLAGATVTVSGIWRMPPPANVGVLPDPANLAALLPPLYSDRLVLPQFIQQRNLTPSAGGDKGLVNDLLPGANPILLSDRQGLTAGDVLLIDAAEPDLAEFIAISTVPVMNPPDQPTLITLEYPVISAHRRNAVVQQVTPSPPGAQQQFTVEANVGDTCVFLDSLAALTGALEVQITGPPGADEYHKLMRFSAVADADGYYRMAPLSRVAQLEIHAEKIIGVQTFQTTTTFCPDYRQRENRLDLTLKV